MATENKRLWKTEKSYHYIGSPGYLLKESLSKTAYIIENVKKKFLGSIYGRQDSVYEVPWKGYNIVFALGLPF